MRTDTHFTKESIGQTMNRGFNPATSPRRQEELAMATGEVHAIDAGHRRRDVIRCLAGRLWLTQEDDLQDHLLQAGDVFFAAHAGRIIVSALENSRVEVASSRNGSC
jgi:quercetin dioxygenase-like cupin family protein